MKIRSAVASAVLIVAGAGGPLLVAPSAHAAAPSIAARSGCTHTSSGSCIRGGEFCPRASYGHSGFDAHHRRYVCKGDRSHPHWMKP